MSQTHMLPIELPLETEENLETIEELDLIEALARGDLQILQIPPNAFMGDFLSEKEVDEQELESIEVVCLLNQGLNYNDRRNILNHMVSIEYDSAGFPLIDRQIHNLGQIFDIKKPEIKIGKLVKYDDGSVEFVVEKSDKAFDVLPTPAVNFKREFITLDDENMTFTQLRPCRGQYSTCLKFDA